MTVNVALVGTGYWGRNLARNLTTARGARLHALCDTREDRLLELGNVHPGVKLEPELARLLDDRDVDAIVVSTPAATHFELARAGLLAGKHVFVEKPLATSAVEARALVDLAATRGLILMVGHVFLYSAAVRQVKAYIDSGELGDVYHVCSQRLNLGVVRPDVNALWNFAPHDVSILNYWFGARPVGLSTRGFSYLQPGVEDVVFMTLEYPGGASANVHISWLDPRKIRTMTVVGSKKMLVYDDVDTNAPIVIHDKCITQHALSELEPAATRTGEFGEVRFLVRKGDVVVPRPDPSEPLQVECRHFIECIETGATPISDGREALGVVEVLEAAQKSLERSGTLVELRKTASPEELRLQSSVPSSSDGSSGRVRRKRAPLPGRG